MTSFPAAVANQWDLQTDEKLIDRMAQGTKDERNQAFDAFYRRHAEFLYGFCYTLANRYQFGFFCEDDIFQATMLKARDHADTFKTSVSPKDQESPDAAALWLCGIAKNVVVDLFRRTPKCVHLDPVFLDGDDENAFDIADEPKTSAETEDIRLMGEAIETLSPKEREVAWAACQFFVCREHQHTPSKELDVIVARLGISKENFRQIKLRAWKKIRNYMTNRKPVAEAK
jgi:RNA polymerase sigma factor (sigma-70 family)